MKKAALLKAALLKILPFGLGLSRGATTGLIS
jgi:hypothetical protein